MTVDDIRTAAGSTALVTGACSGIGRAIAGILAARGHALVLVSDRADALDDAARALHEAHGAVVTTLALDLARATAAAELYEATTALGLTIDVLVNNAGFFFHGEAVDAHHGRANALLQLHVVTPSLLCTRFGHDMRARRRGHILNVSSISAVRALPGIGYYGSSKKYLRGFSRALRTELGPHGVGVTCLLPGATDTALYDPATTPIGLARRLGVMMSAADVAEAGVDALFAGRAECTPGVLARSMALGISLVPQPVIDLAHRRVPWLRRR